MAAPMVPVVGPQFCEPDMVALTVAKKSGIWSDKGFVVTDVNGGILMKVLHHRKHSVLCDAAGNPIISMRQKKMSMHSRWNVYRGDSKDESDLLFTVKRSHMYQLKTELDVFLAGNTAEQDCDFRIKGNWFGSSCTFYLGESDTIIALMSPQNTVKNVLLGRDIFGVTVYPHVDYAFIVAIVVILYEIRARKGGSSGGGGHHGGGGGGGLD